MSMTGDYPNRSDLRNAATRTARFTGQTYGQATQQARSQQAVRPGTQPETLQAQQMAAQGAAGQPRMVPGGQPLMRPTERPSEPITAGADFGEGPGSLEAGVVPRIIQEDDVLMRLREVYRMYPNEGLRMLISRYSGMSI
jgi:hypothetical protein